mgnify:CR=1 FL=1
MGKITAILIGAGLRGGHVYASYALEHPDEFQIVAVAEPDIARRKQIAALHKIPEENQYERKATSERMYGRLCTCLHTGSDAL